MKYYKLKNDLPTFKAGEKFYVNKNGSLVRTLDNINAYSKRTLDKFPNILKDWFEEVEETDKRWRAELNKTYYYVDGYGEISSDRDYRAPEDNYRYSVGNYFKAEEETEAYKKYLIARQVLLDDADGGKFILGGGNWIGLYAYIAGFRYASWDRHLTQNYLPGMIYFRTEELLKKSLKEHKEQWEIVRKYEVGEE